MIAERALADLAWHWGEVYTFSHPSEGRWVAQHKADRRTLTARSARALRLLVRDDYKPVPRVTPGPE